MTTRLRGGGFDVVLYSDTLGSLDREDVHAVASAAGATPVFVIDMWDQCGDYVDDIAQQEGISSKEASSLLLQLELRGWVIAHRGMYFQKAR